jgi:4-alpha-glucanotransferase
VSNTALPESLVHSAELRELLADLGIAESYIDFGGQDVLIPQQDRLQILRLMGESPGSLEEINALRRRFHWLRPGNPLPQRAIVITDSLTVPLYFQPAQLGEQFSWKLRSETGEELAGNSQGGDLKRCAEEHIDGTLYEVREWQLPDISLGYYHLRVQLHGNAVEVLLLRAPSQCFVPGWLDQQEKLAGISIQLYSLRSAQNWGVGDFTDLWQLLCELAPRGIDFLVLNPLHILDALAPDQGSPYSPHDRRYLNPIYIDIPATPEYQSHPDLSDRIGGEAMQRQLETLRATDFVDYPAVLELKMQCFLALFDWLLSGAPDVTGRFREFTDWQRSKGPELRSFAEFEAGRNATRADSRSNADFHCYLQWLAESQLSACQRRAVEMGMRIGLVKDLAVGGTRASAEVQLNPGLFATQASVGAPPDVFAPQGQNWGLPPMSPRALEASFCKHFIALIRENMADCGALRIDHVMALMRLWWCASNNQTGDGAYVYYPVEALFAILRIESQKASCVVVGEDLGVVPPEIRHIMYESAVLSNVLFYFEKYDPVRFKKPEDYPPRALAMVANHDVPTLSGWWNRSDLKLREKIGLLEPGEPGAGIWQQRESDLIQVLHWLQECGQLPDSWSDFNIHRPFDAELCAALLRSNACSASVLVSAQLADICLQEAPVNIPGTSFEYRNWALKLPVEIETMFSQSEAGAMLQSFAVARKA